MAGNHKALQRVKELQKNSKYLEFENQIALKTNKLRLDSFISKPVQRMCKYPLFIKELLKLELNQPHVQKLLQKMLEEMIGVVNNINEYKKEKDLENRQLELIKLIKDLPTNVFLFFLIFFLNFFF